MRTMATRNARIIPVLDVREGTVVHAVAGRRHDYRPVVSRVVNSDQPWEVARGLIRVTEAQELYVADLDAIMERSPIAECILELRRLGVTLWLDAGASTMAMPGVVPVYGSESHDVTTVPCDGIISIDLVDDDAPLTLIDACIERAQRRFILLDLRAVGTSRGIRTLEMARKLRERHPHMELIAGGGVRNHEDLKTASAAGFDAVLVATAIHQGNIISELTTDN